MVLIMIVFVKSADDSYRTPTPEEIGKNYSQKSIETMIDALRYAKIAGMIEESMRCPCYDIQVSTDDYQAILRVDRKGCKEGH